MLPLLVLMLSAPAPAAVRCGGGIESAIADAPAGGVVRLAADCTYEEDVRIDRAAAVTVEGGRGTRVLGRFALVGAGAVTLRDLEVQAQGPAVVARNAGGLTLEGVRLGGIDALYVSGGGEVVLRDVVLVARDTAVWVEQAAGLRLEASFVEGGRLALVVRDVAGGVRIAGNQVRARAAGRTGAAVLVSGQSPVAVVENRFEYLALPALPEPAVVEIEAPGTFADNQVFGTTVGLRLRRPMTVGCNRFAGTVNWIEGPYERMCPRDIAPGRLDWRARIGEPVSISGSSGAGAGPLEAGAGAGRAAGRRSPGPPPRPLRPPVGAGTPPGAGAPPDCDGTRC